MFNIIEEMIVLFKHHSSSGAVARGVFSIKSATHLYRKSPAWVVVRGFNNLPVGASVRVKQECNLPMLIADRFALGLGILVAGHLQRSLLCLLP